MTQSDSSRGGIARLSAFICLIFLGSSVWAGPTGPQVVNGTVTFQQPGAGTLNITNSPGAIINWQGFSIGAGELTRFIQQSSSSAVLNRVVGPDLSQIQGQLLSNGRVFLINPSGIVIGPGAVIDTAGFVGSTLNMLDADFLAGKLRFQGDASSGSIVNQGWIRTGYGGQVILVAPHIENSGLIETPGGQLILAAGQSLTITSLDLEGVQFEVQAPTDSAVNVGKLLADGGAIGVFAGTLRHSGEIRANALVYDEAGRIVLKAQNELQIAAGSTTSADGKIGGSIVFQSPQGLTRIAGQVSAQGSAGGGGDIRVLGDRVSVAESAVVDASGSTGGGQILVGGDYQGNNAAVENASSAFVGASATLRADATQSGDGGRIIVWSDNQTQFYGNLSAQGGASGGNGGFAEVSGKQNLVFAGNANLGAPNGKLGTLMLDPLDVYVDSRGGLDPFIIDESSDFPSNAATVSPATLAAINGNVTLIASRYMRFNDPVNLTTPGQSLTALVGTYIPPLLPDPLALSTSVPNRMEIGANISTNGGAVSLTAPTLASFNTPTITTGGGAISLSTTGAIQASSLSLDAGSGAVTASPGSFLQIGAVTGGSVTASAPSFISTGNISTNGGPVNLTSGTSSVNTSNITAGGGAVSLSGTNVSAGTIDTSGSVALTATAGSIFAGVDNASSLTASASRSGSGTAFISVTSNTDLNATSVSATGSNCLSSFTCPGAFVSLNAAGNINVGAVTASAPVATATNSISESVSIASSGGSIRAMSTASQITATDVALVTGQGTDGGIGTAAAALNVNVGRNFTFAPNGEFNVLLNGTGPNGLNMQLGVAATGHAYSGTLTKSSGGLTLGASATDATVTLNNLAITSGFDQRVFNSNPFITLRVPNGALVANSITVPEGDTVPTTPFVHTEAPLPVNISASGDVTLASYTRQSSGSSLAKSTVISSDSGSVTLGAVNADKDPVTVTAAGAIQAQTDGPGLEIQTTGAIDLTASTIGNSGFVTNPLDLLGTTSISLTSTGGAIGFAAPVIANTQNLTVNSASTFNVSTGAVALNNLTVNADPVAVGSGGLAQVRTEAGGANDMTYNFASNGTDFSLGPWTVPASQFNGGTLSFTSRSGNVTLGNMNFGTGALNVTATDGSISAGTLDGSGFNLVAGTVPGASPVSVTTGNIGITVRPDSLQIFSGNSGFPSGRTGSVLTGDIEAGTIGINSYNGSITVGNIGAATRAGTTTLTSDNRSSGDAGQITAGNVTADSINISRAFNATAGSVTTGNLDATAGIAVSSDSAVSTGTLDASTIGIGATFCCNPSISTGAIGGTTPPSTININGSTVTVGGTVTGNPSATDTINIHAFSGTLSINGGNTVVTGGDGSAISLQSSGAGVLQFSNINAGANGAVSVTSGAGIQQLGAGGITAKTVTLSATNTNADIDGDVSSPTNGSLQLNSTKILTVNVGGSVALNANGSQFDSIAITTSGSGPDTSPVSLTNMGGSQVLTVSDLGNGDFNVALSSPSSPLNFMFNANATGIRTTGGGIATGGGDVTLGASGAFNGSTGGIATGGATGGGAVNITAGGTLTTGQISTIPTGSGTGDSISLGTFCASCPIVVNGNLTTGTGGGFISLFASDGSITRSGGAQISSDASVSVTTFNGDIGASGTPLLITSPVATLRADGAAAGQVFATLTNTAALDLTGDNGFNVSSNTAFNTLSVTTNGSGTGTPGGTLDLAAPGQSYSFARPATDLFGAPITNTFQVVSVSGATPPTNATFTASDGDLLIAGPGTINATNLTLDTFAGDIKLQGSNANPLNLSNTTQNFFSSRDLLVNDRVTLAAGTSQSWSVGRDITLTGNITASAGSNQSWFANRNITAQAQGGSVTISAANQSIASSTGSISLLGGSGVNDSVSVSATSAQNISTNFGGSLLLQGGTGGNAFVDVAYTGTGIQTIYVRNGTVTVKGGDGPGAYAKLESSSTNEQQIGCPPGSFFGCGSPIGTLNVLGGNGSGSYAEIDSNGFQRVTTSGAINLTGNAANASAALRGGSQAVNGGNLTLTGGAGNDSGALIQSATTQQIGSGNLTLQGGAGTAAAAQILAAGTQTLSDSAVLLKGGAGSGSVAQISTTGNQSINFSSLTLLESAAGSDSFAKVAAGGTQTLSGGTVALTAGSAANTGAIIEGHGQTIFSGPLTLTGGTGTSGAASDAVIRNLSGNQNITASSLTLNGGVDFSTTGILNLGSGTQTLSSSGALSLTSNSASTATAPVQVMNAANTRQTVNVQRISVQTTGAGDATLSSAGDQYLRTNNTTTNPSIRVVALGSGTASVQAAGSQLIEVDYPQLMQGTRNGLLSIGDPSAVGNSLIQATDQSVFAGSILVQGGQGAGSVSKLSATNTQTISTLLGGIDVLGGSGANSLATIDPLIQTILANGTISLLGGSGVNADASILSGGAQTILSTNGDITLEGGTATGASALIITSGFAQAIGATGDIFLTPGTAPDADAIIASGNPPGTGAITFSCFSCAPFSFSTSPFGNGIADAGLFGSPITQVPLSGILALTSAGSAASSGSSFLFDTTSWLLSLQEGLNDILSAAGIEEQDLESRLRRAPICR